MQTFRFVFAATWVLYASIGPSLAQAQDSDGDGIPDEWEVAYGLNPEYAPDGAQDPDSDGMSNVMEYRLGSSPFVANAPFRLNVSRLTGQTIQLTWSHARAVLQSSSTLGGTWTQVSGPTSPFVVSATGAQFFRIVVPNPPALFVLAAGDETGTVSPSGVVPAEVGDNLSFTANPSAGFAVDEWILNGVIAQQGGTAFTLFNVQSNSTLVASFHDLSAPLSIIEQPQSATVDAGAPASFQVLATGEPPLLYRWRFNGTALPGEMGDSFALGSASTNDAGGYSVVVSNNAGAITSLTAVLTVRLWDFGDAPAPYPTLLSDNGARHTIVPGFRLGALLDAEFDGQPDPLASGDDTSGVADEDGVMFLSQLLPGQSSTLGVIASAAGRLDAWIDFDGDSYWASPGEQILTNRSLTAGTNVIVFTVPAQATETAGTAARFRFSSTGGLSFDGPADDGEMEDFLVAIRRSVELELTGVSTPDMVAPGTLWTVTLTITNAGELSASGVVLTNQFSSGVTVISAQSSQGTLTTNGASVACDLGTIAVGGAATVQVAAMASALGSLTSGATVSSSENDLDLSNNALTLLATVLESPVITVQPQNVQATNGDHVMFTVTATGAPPLAYQWSFQGAPLPDATDASLLLVGVTTNQAGAYRVVVTNAVGAITSSPANLTVGQQFIVESSATGAGTVSPTGQVFKALGESQSFTATPDFPASTVTHWFLDGTNVQSGTNTFELINITSDHAVSVLFVSTNPTTYDLVSLTNTPWRYDQSGSDLGTSWKEPSYDDSAWPTGLGLFGVEVPGTYPYPFQTPLAMGGGQITYYFRTTFLWTNDTTNVFLIATNYIDDGAVFYLNGLEVGRLRLLGNPVLFDTLASQQMNEGAPETLIFPGSSLVQGTNYLAVEVHQTTPVSSDVVFGMNLEAEAPPRSAVTVDKTFVIVCHGETVTIEATGTPEPPDPNNPFEWTKAPSGAGDGDVELTVTNNGNKSTATIKGIKAGYTHVYVRYKAKDHPASQTVDIQVLVVSLRFIETDEDNGVALLPLFNPSPIVVLDTLAAPGTETNPAVTVEGLVTCYTAPVAKDYILINGVTPNTYTVVDDGAGKLGPYKRRFKSKPILIGHDDFTIVATAVNGLDNVGTDSLEIRVDRNDDGTISGRTVVEGASVPGPPGNENAFLDAFRFRIEMDDPAASAIATNAKVFFYFPGGGGNEYTLDLDTQTDTFRSKNLFLVPKYAGFPHWPIDFPSEVVNTRIAPPRFGYLAKLQYEPRRGTKCVTTGIPTGMMFKRTRTPVPVLWSSTAKELTNGSGTTYMLEAGGPGGTLGKTTAARVTSLDRLQAPLAAPSPAGHYAPVQVTGDPVKLTRVSDDPASPEFHLYRSPSNAPLMMVRGRMPLNAGGVAQDNTNLTELTVNYRGYVKADVPAISGAVDSRPVAGLAFLLANPTDPTSEDLHPPLVESDFLPLFNPSPVVLITAPTNGNIGAPVANQTVRIEGEVVSFISPIARTNVTINGATVATYNLDTNNPPGGPWRARFTHDFLIDLQMRVQTVQVCAWDVLRNLGCDSLTLTAAGGGLNPANGNPAAVTDRGATNGATLPDSAAVQALIDNNTVTLKEAIAFLRNRQFRLEINPVLRGKLPLVDNWMIDTDNLRLARQTNAAGATDRTSGRSYSLDVKTNRDGSVTPGGGAGATARLVLIPQLRTADNATPPEAAPIVPSFRANPGVFAQASIFGGSAAALASPVGALIQQNLALQSDVIIPGHQADVGTDPADLSLRVRLGAAGFDLGTGAGRATVNATLRSLTDTGAALAQPAPRQLSRNDAAPPGGAVDRAQYENFPRVSQNLTLHRLSNDPREPGFHLFRYKKTATDNEEVITSISTGTFPAGATRTADEVSETDDRGLHLVQTAGWLEFTSAAAPLQAVIEPVFGPFVAETEMVTTLVDPAGAENAMNFENDRDFSPQMQERPILNARIVAAPDTPTNANFLLRMERRYVKAANPNSDLVPAGETGDQVVAYLDLDAAVAGHQERVALQRPGAYRFPPADPGSTNLVRVGMATAAQAPSFANVPQGVSQTAFEGLNLPLVAITQTNAGSPRRGLPPGRYWIRPVMQAPLPGAPRFVLGNNVSLTLPYVVQLRFDFDRDTNGVPEFFEDLTRITNFGLIDTTNLAVGVQTNLRAAYINQLVALVKRDYAVQNPVSGANSVNVRFIPRGGPNVAQPAITDFVVPVNMGGRAPGAANNGLTGLTVTYPEILNSQTDEAALIDVGGTNSPVRGIFPRAFLSAFGGTAAFNGIFASFQGGNPAFGAVGGATPDNPAALIAVLNGGIANAPAVPGGGAAWNRNQAAQNAAVAFCRMIARTTTHELGHTLGLVGGTAEATAYVTAFNMPAGRENNYRVGDGSAHNSHLGVGVQPLFSAPGVAGLVSTDDLGNTTNAAAHIMQNYYLDSGGNSSLSERMEPASSTVRTSAAIALPLNEPQTTFTPRNLLLLRAVLPYQPR